MEAVMVRYHQWQYMYYDALHCLLRTATYSFCATIYIRFSTRLEKTYIKYRQSLENMIVSDGRQNFVGPT